MKRSLFALLIIGLIFGIFFFWRSAQVKNIVDEKTKQIKVEIQTNNDYPFKVGDKLGYQKYFGEISSLTLIKQSFKLGTNSDPISLERIKKILPGSWQFDVHCRIYIDDNLNYMLVDYENISEGMILDVGRIDLLENELTFIGEIKKVTAQIKNYEFYNEQPENGEKYFGFLIVFSKTLFLAHKQGTGMSEHFSSE